MALQEVLPAQCSCWASLGGLLCISCSRRRQLPLSGTVSNLGGDRRDDTQASSLSVVPPTAHTGALA